MKVREVSKVLQKFSNPKTKNPLGSTDEHKRSKTDSLTVRIVAASVFNNYS